MSNPGGKLGRANTPPETILIDHENRIKILERGGVVSGVIVESGGTLLWGIGPPTNPIGIPNDFFIDIDTGRLYGPKTEVWDTGTYIKLIHDYADFFVRDRRFALHVEAGAPLVPDVNNVFDAWAASIPAVGQHLIRATANFPCRWRCYQTVAQRAADASRALGDLPDVETNHGLLLELVFDTDLLTIDLSPAVFLSHADYSEGNEGTISSVIPSLLTNLDSVDRTIELDLEFVLHIPPTGSTFAEIP